MTNKQPNVEEKEHMEIHMKCLSKSKNAKECGDLTVIPMGFAVQMIKEAVQAERQKQEEIRKEAVEEERKYKEAIHKAYNVGFNVDCIQCGLKDKALGEAL